MCKKILIVDDDPGLLQGLSIRLKAHGYKVVCASDAVSVMSVALEEKPDLIILDLGLPGSDGFLVMQNLKTERQLASIPIIVFSARAAIYNEEKALKLGATAFFEKPADNKVLLAGIQKTLEE